MKEEKAKLREYYKNKRAQLTREEIELLSLDILTQFKIWLSNRNQLTHFHLFLPIKKHNEINTFLIKDYLETNNKKVYSSGTIIGSLEMDTYLLSPEIFFKENQLDIPIPIDAEKAEPNNLEVILIPLLAFDIFGNRIGYGKGYYDVFLSKLHPDILKVGLNYFLPEENIPAESHDIRLDFCITPEKIFTF